MPSADTTITTRFQGLMTSHASSLRRKYATPAARIATTNSTEMTWENDANATENARSHTTASAASPKMMMALRTATGMPRGYRRARPYHWHVRPDPSPDVLVVLRSPDVPGYLDVRAHRADGPRVASTFRTGGPGAACIGAGEMVIGAPHPAPAGSRRLLLGPDDAHRGYLEYRWQLSPARCVTALVDDDGVRAWTRERSGAAALLHRFVPQRTMPATAVMMGQEEVGEVAAIDGGYRLRWHGADRLPVTQAALLAVALGLPH